MGYERDLWKQPFKKFFIIFQFFFFARLDVAALRTTVHCKFYRETFPGSGLIHTGFLTILQGIEMITSRGWGASKCLLHTLPQGWAVGPEHVQAHVLTLIGGLQTFWKTRDHDTCHRFMAKQTICCIMDIL